MIRVREVFSGNRRHLGSIRAQLRSTKEELVAAGVRRGLPPAWFGYRHVIRETVQNYFLRHAGDTGAGRYETVHPEAVAENPLPRNVSSRDDLPADRGWWGYSFHDVPQRTSSETFIATLPDCLITWYRDPEKSDDFFPAILNRDVRALDMREVRFRPLHAATLCTSEQPARLKKATWFIERVYHNHSHWLTAHLPKLLLLRERGMLGDVLMPTERTIAMDGSLRMLGLEPEQFQAFDLERPLFVEELTIMGTDRFRPELLQMIPEAFGVTGADTPHRKIFISRLKASRRRLVNEDEVWSLLGPLGFERVFMEEMTFAAQVKLMRETTVLCALHGAGMTNMVFCPSGAHIIEIADFGYPSPNFYAIAAAMKHHYWLLGGEASGKAVGGRRGADAPGWRDLGVNISALQEVLTMLPRVRVEAGMKTSVMVPCHNAGPYLAQTVGSVLEQSNEPTEIIIVDNGSTNGSLAIARRFEAACDGRVSLKSVVRRYAPASFRLAWWRAWSSFGRVLGISRAFLRNFGRNYRRSREVQRLVRSFPTAAEDLINDFRGEASPIQSSYEGLFLYFVQGWAAYRRPDRAGARYPGLRGLTTLHMDEMEGFSRIMPLFGAWVHSGRSPRQALLTGDTIDLVEEFAAGVIAGTDPDSTAYWGAYAATDHRIVEATDIALALWLFRDTVWTLLPPVRRQAIVSWLNQVNAAPVKDNNWHLFVVLVDRVLASLGAPVRHSTARAHFERVKEFHLGDGWFMDGPGGRVDYYNAWSFHYLMTWIDRIDPLWDPEWIRQRQREFLATYKYFMGPQGFPVLGRSVCYRMAAPAPLVAGHLAHPDIVSPGEARRALDCTWSYFIRHGALWRGNLEQGYFRTDPRIFDNYSGPASSLWSLRSLLEALLLPTDAQFWEARPQPLPVEREDFEVSIEGTGWIVRGEKATSRISIEIPANFLSGEPLELEPFTWSQRFFSVVYDRPNRPKNERAKYEQRYYHSSPPFCVKTRETA